jgi:hypothetical protein
MNNTIEVSDNPRNYTQMWFRGWSLKLTDFIEKEADSDLVIVLKYYTGVIWFLMYVWLLKIILMWWFFSFIILQLTVLTVYAFLYGKTYLVSCISSCLDVCAFFSFLLIFVTLSVKCSFSIQYLFNLLDCYCDNSVVKPDLGLSLDLNRRCLTHFSFT